MIPIRLKLKGIYSYKQEQEIDFQKLASARIFGIFGNVGSGKSTIIEAISYALFGETERLNLKENRGYNMMNLRSNSMLIEFEFFDYKNQKFKFVVEGKRNSKNFQKMTKFERSGYQEIANSWQAIDVNDIEKIIGMNYKNFRRTVIIPQGKFAEFLKLTEKDRTTMMKEIFGLEKYELYDNVARLDTKNNKKIDVLKGQLIQLGEIDLNQIQNDIQVSKNLEVKIEKLKNEISQKEERRIEIERIKDKFQQKNNLMVEFDSLKSQREKYKTLELETSEFDNCQKEFAILIQKETDLKTEVLELKNKYIQMFDERKKYSEAKVQKEQSFKPLEEKYNNLNNSKQKSKDIESILKIKTKEEELKTISTQNDSFESELKLIKNELLEKEKSLENLEQTSLKSEDVSKKFLELSEIKSWFETQKNILHEFHRFKEQLESTQLDFKTLLDSSVSGLKNLTDLSKHLEKLGEKKIEIEKSLFEIERIIEDVNIKASLNEFAQKLKEGEKCPICGSDHHPEKLEIKNIKKELNKYKIQKAEIEKNITKIETEIQELEKLHVTLKIKSDLIKKEKENYDYYELRVKEHLKQFVWEEFSPVNEDKVEEALVQIKRKQLEEEKHKIQMDSLKEDIKEIRGRIEIKEKSFNEKHILKSKLESEIDSLKTTILFNDLLLQPHSELSTSFTEIQNEISDVEKYYETRKNELLQIQTQLSEITGSLKQLQNQYESKHADYKLIESELSQKAVASEFKTVENINLILQKKIDIQSNQRIIEEYKAKYNGISEQLSKLDTELINSKFDENELDSLIKQIESEKTIFDSMKSEFITLKNQILKNEKDIETHKDLNQQLSKLEKRSENLKILKSMFIGQKFVSYLSTIYLENLCAGANKRFLELTKHSLQLEIDETNNFIIRDFLNDGQTRSIKTLSGGQTFQASLCLALALSENIQSQNKAKQTFFFIDEGFGSLDRNSLDSVLDALRTLKEEGRTVGIISHVEDLQREIDSYVKVVNDNESGSKVILN